MEARMWFFSFRPTNCLARKQNEREHEALLLRSRTANFGIVANGVPFPSFYVHRLFSVGPQPTNSRNMFALSCLFFVSPSSSQSYTRQGNATLRLVFLVTTKKCALENLIIISWVFTDRRNLKKLACELSWRLHDGKVLCSKFHFLFLNLSKKQSRINLAIIGNCENYMEFNFFICHSRNDFYIRIIPIWRHPDNYR